jgi:hypothetical protein
MRRGGLWLLLFALLAAAPALACRLAAEGVATPAASPTAFAVATATSAPAEEVPGQTLASFDSEELGLSFQYPAAWSLDTSDDIPMLVSDERLFEEALGSVDGAVVLFLVDDAANMGEGPLDQLVEEVVADMVTGGVTVDGPRLLTINGQEAATITVESVEESGAVALSTVTAIRHEGRAVLISAAAPQATAGEYEQSLDTVVNSVRLRPAAGPAVAGTLGYGESVRGEVAGLRGSAWRFRGAAGDVIDIEVTPVNEELDVTVDVQDSTGRSILPDGVVDEAFGTETIRRLELPAAGDYLIVLRGFAGSTGGYTLALSAQRGEAATPAGGYLVIGESYRGRLARNAVDSYQLPETGETISLEVIPDAELDVVLDVFAADGSLQASADTGFSGMRERLTVIAAGGTVQVRGFAGDSGEYTLHVEAGAEEGVRIVASNELQPGDSSHSFPFTAPAGAVVTAEVVPEDGLDIAIDIWNDDDGSLQETVDLSFGVENASLHRSRRRQLHARGARPGGAAGRIHDHAGRTSRGHLRAGHWRRGQRRLRRQRRRGVPHRSGSGGDGGHHPVAGWGDGRGAGGERSGRQLAGERRRVLPGRRGDADVFSAAGDGEKIRSTSSAPATIMATRVGGLRWWWNESKRLCPAPQGAGHVSCWADQSPVASFW